MIPCRGGDNPGASNSGGHCGEGHGGNGPANNSNNQPPHRSQQDHGRPDRRRGRLGVGIAAMEIILLPLLLPTPTVMDTMMAKVPAEVVTTTMAIVTALPKTQSRTRSNKTKTIPVPGANEAEQTRLKHCPTASGVRN